jgi:hypothetical protein
MRQAHTHNSLLLLKDKMQTSRCSSQAAIHMPEGQ